MPPYHQSPLTPYHQSPSTPSPPTLTPEVARAAIASLQHEEAGVRSWVNRLLAWSPWLIGLAVIVLFGLDRTVGLGTTNNPLTDPLSLVLLGGIAAAIPVLVLHGLGRAAAHPDPVHREYGRRYSIALGFIGYGVLGGLVSTGFRGVAFIAALAASGALIAVGAVIAGLAMVRTWSQTLAQMNTTDRDNLGALGRHLGTHPVAVLEELAMEAASGLTRAGLPLAHTGDAASWSLLCDVAAAHRRALRAEHDVAAPERLASHVLEVAFLALLGAVFIASLGSLGDRDGASSDAIATAVVLTALLGLRARREGAALLMRRLRHQLEGAATTRGATAGRRELDWLDAHRWGPTHFVRDVKQPFDQRDVVVGTRGGWPVMATRARAATLHRHLTSLYIARPVEPGARLSPRLAHEVGSWGFSAAVGRDGIRVSRPRSSLLSAYALSRLLPLLTAPDAIERG